MPSVAMNGGIFSLAIRVPETAPQSAPVAIAATTPSHIGRPQLVSNTPDMTAQKVISVPTERSMPPVMMTKVRRRQHAVDRGRLQDADDIVVCMKSGEAKLKKISSRIRLAKASSFCSAAEPSRRLGGAFARCACGSQRRVRSMER